MKARDDAATVVAAIACALMLVGSVAAEEPVTWHETFDAAVEAAEVSGKPVLAEFHSAGCGPCVRMEHETLADPEVTALIREHFEAVRISALKQPELATRYLVSFYPTVKFIGAGGEAVDDCQGFVPADDFLDVMNRALTAHNALQRARAAAADPDGTAEGALSIARDFYSARRHRGAAEWARTAIEADAQEAVLAEARYILGAASTDAGEPAKARQPLVTALKGADGAVWQWSARLKLGYVWLQLGEENSGVGLLQTVFTSEQASADVRSEAGRLLRWWGVETD